MRTDKAKVIAIFVVKYCENLEVEYTDEIEVATSSVYANGFKYSKGEIVVEPSFDPDLFKICVPVIHFVLSQEDALLFHKMYNTKILNPTKIEKIVDDNEKNDKLIDQIDDHKVKHIKVNFEIVGKNKKVYTYSNSDEDKLETPVNKRKDETICKSETLGLRKRK